MCCVDLERPTTLFPEVSCGSAVGDVDCVVGLCGNNMVLEAKGLFALLGSGGYWMHAWAFLFIPAPGCDIYRQ